MSASAAAAFALGDPQHGVAHLLTLSARDAWGVEALPWAALDFASIPRPVRAAIADMVAQLSCGERAALLGATRFATTLPAGLTRDMCIIQAKDEARHVRFFEALTDALGEPGQVRTMTDELVREIAADPTPEGLMVGLQILMEGAAHAFFVDAPRAFAGLAETPEIAMLLEPLRLVATDWLPRRLAKDESRHVAFGMFYLAEHVPNLGRDARRVLETKVERWGHTIARSAADPDVVSQTGLDGAFLCGRAVAHMNRRLAQVGLDARVELA
ncbi:MAG: hypothetical protein HOO96_03005 [Polyangiaceae bacterium]|nr:hypothetical protein [Polyangiaceae bacterium]